MSIIFTVTHSATLATCRSDTSNLEWELLATSLTDGAKTTEFKPISGWWSAGESQISNVFFFSLIMKIYMKITGRGEVKYDRIGEKCIFSTTIPL